MRDRTIYVLLSFYYSLVFAALGAYNNYLGLYYNEIHLSHFQIGLLTTVGSITALFLQPFWGLAADRAASKNRMLLLVLLLTTASVWLIPLSANYFWLLVVCSVIFYSFQCVINPLGDTITMELAAKSGFAFSRIRTAGSLGYAIMVGAAGWILDRNLDYIFVVFSVIIFTAFLIAWFIPKVEGYQRGKSKVALKQLFTNRKLLWIYVYTFAVESTLGFFYTFQAIYSQEQGLSTSLIGLGIAIGSFSQFPFMIFFDSIYKRFGIMNILLFSGVVHLVRWVLLSTTMHPAAYLFTWVLHGGTFMLFYLCLAEYVSRHVQKELKTSGQMMNSLVLNAISRTAGSLAGGFYASWYGIRSGFIVSSIICFAAVFLLWLYMRRNAKLSGLTEARPE
jgi:PPP family 3-phenylpropionic acid transporter